MIKKMRPHFRWGRSPKSAGTLTGMFMGAGFRKGVSYMDQILAQLKSPVFWVLTIFGSLILNVVSHYITRALDRGASFLSRSTRDLFDPRGNIRAARERKYAEWIDKTEGGAALLIQKAVSLKLTATICALLVLLFMVGGAVMEGTHSSGFTPVIQAAFMFDTLAFTVTTLVLLNRSRKLEAAVNSHKKGFADFPGMKPRTGVPPMLENVRPER
jgi:hypothetical protein